MSDQGLPRHPIRVVCRRTGLKPDVVRAWERRYAAVTPARTETDRRLYSDADIERLQLLRRAVGGGRSISQVANMAALDLAQLVAQDADRVSVRGPEVLTSPEGAVAFHLERALEAIRQLDASALMRQFELASVDLSRRQLLEELVVPLMHDLGRLWRTTALSPAHEHLSSSVVRTFLGSLAEAFRPSPNAPRILVTTPANQWHELGALIAATTAAGEGWSVTYLGANLPATDIAHAAVKIRARAIAISLTFPEDDPLLGDELRRLRELVGERMVLLVGGRAIDAYRGPLDEIGARRAHDLKELRSELAQLRTSD